MDFSIGLEYNPMRKLKKVTTLLKQLMELDYV